MPHPYLSFSDSTNCKGKVLGTSNYQKEGNGLTNPYVSYIQIPPKYENVKVVEIGYRSLTGTNVIGIFIPKTIQFIAHDAFWNCKKLSDVRFEKGSQLKTFASCVFQDCTSLKNVDIPPSTKEIAGSSTDYMFKLTSAVTCFSYLGSTDFSTAYVFYNTPTIHVSDSIYPAGKQFGQRNVIRDGKTCGTSNEPFYKNICNVSILVRKCHPNLMSVIILLMVSS